MKARSRPNTRLRFLWLVAVFYAAGVAAAGLELRSAGVVTIDASKPFDAPETGYLRLGGEIPQRARDRGK